MRAQSYIIIIVLFNNSCVNGVWKSKGFVGTGKLADGSGFNGQFSWNNLWGRWLQTLAQSVRILPVKFCVHGLLGGAAHISETCSEVCNFLHKIEGIQMYICTLIFVECGVYVSILSFFRDGAAIGLKWVRHTIHTCHSFPGTEIKNKIKIKKLQ